MRKLLFLSVFTALFAIINLSAQAQSLKPSVLSGDVTAISDSKIVLQTKDGAVDVQLSGTTEYKRVSPENLSQRADSKLSEIAVGDRVLVTGILADDKKNIPAKSVYLMTKADISKRNDTDREAWKTRSVSGRVVSVSPELQQFTIASRGTTGEQNIIVSQKLNISYRRYAPDSVKFDDAKASSFAEIKVGDQIRALGDKNADGTGFRAERVVAGSFKTTAGTITAIDTAKNEITIKDLQSGKPLTVVVNTNTMLKKFPAEFAQMMSMRMGGGTGAVQPPNGGNAQGGNMTMTRPPQSTQPTGGQPQTGGQNTPNGMGQGGGMRGGRGEFDDMLERFPTINVADLKVGEAIAISSSTGTDPSRATAIKLVSGVEPFLRAQTAATGAGRGGRGGADFNIPGLDGGIGTP